MYDELGKQGRSIKDLPTVEWRKAMSEFFLQFDRSEELLENDESRKGCKRLVLKL